MSKIIIVDDKKTKEIIYITCDKKQTDEMVKTLNLNKANCDIYGEGSVPFEKLPVFVANKVKSQLKYADDVFVLYNPDKGEFSVTSFDLLPYRAIGSFVLGRYYAKEFYSEAEKTQFLQDLLGY